MAILSIDYAQKLRAIRKIEKLTQREFAELTDLSLSTVRCYESGQKPARAEVMEKVLQVDKFRQYTAWLLYDDKSLKFNQNITGGTADRTNTDKVIDKKDEKVTEEMSSQSPDMLSIINNLSNLDNDEIKQLSRLLSRRGTMLLLELLDPDNQSLLNLSGKKKRVALRLESMGEKQFREILSRIEGDTDSPQEEINVFSKKTAG
ncbi:helix-turn-helix domain-containing protein [Arsenophonus sp. PmNCSU2021_1]|uniref:helix-turn-helix domain-containing protein n=1 Tax=Arsenophonus sp. PmNCSU2021_1 TaxID=3118989 RepID=UPI002FF3AE16